MRTFVRLAVLLLATTALCQARIAGAEDFHWVSGGSQPATSVNDAKAAATEPASSSSCCPSSCSAATCGNGSCCDLGCDPCPDYGIVGFFGVDSFKGISDGDYQGNFGAVTGLNAALPVPGLRNYGIGWQLGMSYGVYDFDGRDSSFDHQGQCQEQIFVTTGFFHKAEGDQRLSYGVVYDWMINNNWGVFGTAPTLGQWRGQIEYALSGCNAVGVWGCVRDLRSQQNTSTSMGYRCLSKPGASTRSTSSGITSSRRAPIAGCGSASPTTGVSAATAVLATGWSAPGRGAVVGAVGPVRQRQLFPPNGRCGSRCFHRQRLRRQHGHYLVLRRPCLQPFDQRRLRVALHAGG